MSISSTESSKSVNLGVSESPFNSHVTRNELAAMTGKSPRFWLRLEQKRIGPPVFRLGKTPLYRIAAVKAWMESQEQLGKKSRRNSGAK